MDTPAPTPAELRLAQLARLTALGIELAEAMARNALRALEADPAPGTPAADPSRAFARMSRAIRQTMALHARLEQGPAVLSAPAPVTPQHHIIRHAMAKKIGREKDPSDHENLLRDLNEHLADPDLSRDIATRPADHIIAWLCCELGLEIDFKTLSDEALAYTMRYHDPTVPMRDPTDDDPDTPWPD